MRQASKRPISLQSPSQGGNQLVQASPPRGFCFLSTSFLSQKNFALLRKSLLVRPICTSAFRVLGAACKELFLEEKKSHSLPAKIGDFLEPHVRALGYELLDVEYQPRSSHGDAVIRLFIESLDGHAISFDDCIKVDHGLDVFFESEEFSAILSQSFTLEVSSPGIDRPLKRLDDFQKFAGQRAQIKTFRPLSLEEMGNGKYFEHHQKQKNFFGILRGISGESVQLETDNETYHIPYALITKANLDVAASLSVSDAKE